MAVDLEINFKAIRDITVKLAKKQAARKNERGDVVHSSGRQRLL
jgi:hypothetical protein